MKTFLVCLMLGVSKLILAQETTTVTITVENLTSEKGQVVLGMFTEDTFMKAKPEFSDRHKIEGSTATFVFENVPTGTYAVSCYHDTNNNDQLDFEANGMPKEDYGISNNPMLYGPPTWADAKFEVTQQPTEITIRM